MSISQLTFPKLSQDVVAYLMEFLQDPREVCQLARVSKFFNAVLDRNSIWVELSKREGIPILEGDSCRRKDIQVLYPMTNKGVSGAMIDRYFGSIVGDLPHMSRTVFDKIMNEELHKKGFVIVVDPEKIKVSIGSSENLILDSLGRMQLASDPVAATEIECSLSLHNLRSLWPKLFSNRFLDGSQDRRSASCVCVMKETILVPSGEHNLDVQIRALQSQGFRLTAARVRVLFDLVRILNSGSCPDGDSPWTYVCCPEKVVPLTGNTDQLVIGGFAPGYGLEVNRLGNLNDRLVGVVPCVSDILAS